MSAGGGTPGNVPPMAPMIGFQPGEMDAEALRADRERVEAVAKRDNLDEVPLDDLDGLKDIAMAIRQSVAYVNDVVNYVTAKKGLKVMIIIQEAPSILGRRKTFPEIKAFISREL